MLINKEAEHAGDRLQADKAGSHVQISWTDLAGSPRDYPKRARSLFPLNEAHRIGRFVRESDRRLRYAAAGLLVDMARQAFGDSDGLLFERNRFGRLCVSGVENADISISYSGEIAVCALSANGRIGIDIERLRPIDTGDFDRVLPESLMELLRADRTESRQKDGDEERFFHAWTRLESVIKADGRGLSAPLGDIVFSVRRAYLGAETWHLNTLSIIDGYVCSIATYVPAAKFEVKRVTDSDRSSRRCPTTPKCLVEKGTI